MLKGSVRNRAEERAACLMVDSRESGYFYWPGLLDVGVQSKLEFVHSTMNRRATRLHRISNPRWALFRLSKRTKYNLVQQRESAMF